MPANEVLWKHENECCVLKWIWAVKKEMGISWESQEPLMHKIHKGKVLITPQESGPASLSQPRLSNIKVFDFCVFAELNHYSVLPHYNERERNRGEQASEPEAWEHWDQWHSCPSQGPHTEWGTARVRSNSKAVVDFARLCKITWCDLAVIFNPRVVFLLFFFFF